MKVPRGMQQGAPSCNRELELLTSLRGQLGLRAGQAWFPSSAYAQMTPQFCLADETAVAERSALRRLQ